MIKKYILASGSPRRKEILTQVGISFKVIPSDCEEKYTSKDPEGIVKELSYIKAKDVSDKLIKKTLGRSFTLSEEICIYVIGADTMVFVDDEKLGKPANRQEAYDMIFKIEGRDHNVSTGVTIIKHRITNDGRVQYEKAVTFSETSIVSVMPMTKSMINEYIDTPEPYDKAGGYGIQGIFAKYIEKIDGDYYNIVGFPVCRFIKELLLLDI